MSRRSVPAEAEGEGGAEVRTLAPNSMRTAHRLIGFLFVAVFLGTGVYMRVWFPEAYENDPGMRMMFRSAHVYILLSALLNLLVGAHLQQCVIRRRRILQNLGSCFLFAVPALFTAAFFLEPAPKKLGRPIVLCGLVLAVTGSVLHTLVSYESERA